MNKIAKRLVAGASAAALLVSAVGVDQLADLFTKTSYAVYSGKIAKSTGFQYLEQDTTANNEKYNTGYGLHTNKTATEVGSDGRTFDVDLESWYVGENPVDVATILDASGSMAWTVDTLKPLEIDYSALGTPYDTYEELKELQDTNGGYLPQDVVDKILKPEKTDNSKLSYAGYKYYVYENRSSVSEFVPLGYWNGGKTAEKFSPIGYYPFNGTLENKAQAGATATVIKRVSSGSTFDTTPLEDVPVELQFKNSGLSLSEVDKKGNVIIDLSNQLDTTQDIEIDFDLRFDNIVGNMVPQSPILYLGDGTTSNYFALVRGRSNTSTGASTSLSILGKGISSTTVANKQITNYTKWYSCKLSISSDGDNLTVVFTMDGGTPVTVNNIGAKLGDKLILTLGGNEILPHGNLDTNDDGIDDIDPTNLKGNYIRNLTISGTNSTGGDFSAEFSLQNKDDGLTDSTSGIEAKYYQQSSGSEFDVKNLAVTSPVEYIGNALNLTQTAAKNSAVKLDAKPVDSTYTIMFKVKTSRKLENKSGADDRDRGPQSAENLFYIGSNDTSNDYYHIGIPDNSDPKHLHFYEYNSKSNEDKKISDGDRLPANNGVFGDTNSKYVAYVIDGTNINSYFDIAGSIKKGSDTLTNELDTSDINVILAGLTDTYSNNFEISIDDLYIFDEALDEDQVKLVAENVGKTQFAKVPSALTDGCKGYHATMKDTDVDIAQISERLAQNPNDEERKGWYYVNSASNWADIAGCLASGKQYVGIFTDEGLPDGIKDNVTIPAGMDDILKQSIKEYEDTSKLHADYDAPTTERSIRFYVDGMNHLRCFVWSGADSKADKEETKDIDESDPRTFCSLVYEKKDNQQTKYQALNGALNGFYKELAGYSDLSNTAVVRFSTINAVGKVGTKEGTEKDAIIKAADENLKMLVMKDWTNWSDYYQADMEKHKTDSDYMPDTEDYLQNLLDVEGKTSISTTQSNARNDIDEYPYVMTGGTYTWTGLKAFYDNMVKSDGKTTGYKPYDIANDARDKYLIIFTDGRDNTQDLGTADNGKVYNDTAYCKDYRPKDYTADCDGKLAKAWADQLKDEGYTIYCVMMATGSISESANETEYKRAYKFLTTLAGANEGDERDLETASDPKATDRYIRVVKNDSTALNDAFAAILKDIQLPRNDYTVQDYIDPRFDLIGKAYVDDAETEVIYHLGANGEVTFTDTNNKKLEDIEVKVSEDTKVTLKSSTAVGNIIDDITNTKIISLPYTPIESYMVNRKADSSSDDGYNTGDGFGTGYIYYDDVKDMYYLRWTDQIIPMENEAFDTEVGNDDTYLDVWSATIRLKAKEDFIGGNNILTNGNEAGENLVYSDATIDNMTDNPELYGLTADSTYRQKLAVLSGTDRKINAVDAGGVSQAVYGNGIDIPSSGFPRTTVNVRLLKLDAKNLNDVIYMGEVVSPTMMLADLENGYMTGSYYLQYLERYAYRVYGDEAGKMPLIELLNKWLKIDDKNQEKKTFTIPYIYLPDPEYNADGTLAKDGGKVKLQNSTGWDSDKQVAAPDFADLNLRDVTGFITYTWKRDDEDVDANGKIEGDEREPQQVVTDAAGNEIYDITKDYVAKNTKQIKYNLQLKFTPLKETAAGLTGFELDKNFIKADPTTSTGGDKFFNIVSGEFNDTSVTAWTTDYGRADYLQAMIQEKRTYTPHVIYDDAAGDGKGKWELVAAGGEADACETYADGDDQITADTTAKTVTDKGVYDWDSTYKKAPGKVQLEGKDLNTYTSTPENVNFANATGEKLSVGETPVSLVANTTYTKDVVNGALALELFVDGKYLGADSLIRTNGTTAGFTFDAVRYYDDPIDPPPYDEEHPIGADTNATDGQKYQLTFKVDTTSLPTTPQENTIYQVWATLEEVKVENPDSTGNYVSIKDTGYTDVDALPIGTYEIKTEPDTATGELNSLKNDQFKIGTNATDEDVNFKYLKIENDKQSYAYDKFPESVYKESDTAAESTKDGEYLIWNEDTSKDNSKKNIADNKRVKDSATDTQTVTFYFGTVAEKTVSEDITLTNTKGVSVKEYLKENPDDPTLAEFKNDYAKDRLGIIMLSASTNSLAITKEVKNTNAEDNKNHEWDFTVTIETDDSEWAGTHAGGDLDYTLYNFEGGTWVADTTTHNAKYTITEAGGKYTLTITGVKVKHNQKAVFSGLPEGTWKVTEDLGGVFCTPHNDQSEFDEDEWQYNRADSTRADIDLTPASQVNYINEFPYELPSTGGSGTVRYLLMGTALISVGAMLFAVLFFDRRKKARK